VVGYVVQFGVVTGTNRVVFPLFPAAARNLFFRSLLWRDFRKISFRKINGLSAYGAVIA